MILESSKNNLLQTIKPLQLLEGSWSGNGVGYYPTMEPFKYREETEFTVVFGEPYIQMTQKAWLLEGSGNELIHWETGIISAQAPECLKLYTCHMNGRIEIAKGIFENNQTKYKAVFISEVIKNELGLKTALSSKRTIIFDNDCFEYSMEMATSDVLKSENHIKATLARVK